MKLKIAKLSAVVALALVTACTSTKNTTQHQNSSTSEIQKTIEDSLKQNQR